MASNKAIEVTVSIVNTNNRQLLENCLESLFKNLKGVNAEVFVVDNASTDGSAEMAKKKFGKAKIIENPVREGFAANHNKVLHIGKGRYFLVLNEDTILKENAVGKMLEFADSNPKAGIVGPKVLNADGSLQDSCVRFPTLPRKIKSSIFQRFCSSDVNSFSMQEQGTAFQPDWIRGSCLLIRNGALRQVGVFDECFFIFFEEVDLCRRMAKAGWQTLFCPGAEIIHFNKQTVSKQNNSLRMDAQMALSELLYFGKHNGFASTLGLRAFNTAYSVLRLTKAIIPPNNEERARLRKLLPHIIWLSALPQKRLLALAKNPGGFK